MFEPMSRLALGLFTGFLFGFLLQKGQVTKYRTIVGQFLLKDFTMLKVMLTAVIVGGFGVYALNSMELTALHIKPLVMGGIVMGGVIFGVGMAVLGYCPGTGVAALAEGKRDAIFGVLGMLVGAAIYAEVFPWFRDHVLTLGDYGKVTLADLTGLPALAWLAIIAIGSGLLFMALERLSPRPPQVGSAPPPASHLSKNRERATQHSRV
ncbi:MAG: YeeE/YedE family protein [Planctomycetales bacterium]|nr:YeeE/YedE family protein [Planctomycetales bacterium]